MMYPILSIFFFTIVRLASQLGEGRTIGEWGIPILLGITPPRTPYQDQMLLNGMTYEGEALDPHREMMNP
jgi:hypothetical protein